MNFARDRDKDPAMAHPPLEEFVAAAAAALDLPLPPDWRASVQANLAVTLGHAATVAEFALPDEAEPAPPRCRSRSATADRRAGDRRPLA